MSTVPFNVGGGGLDLSPRFARSATVAASPAAAAETVVASTTFPGGIPVKLGVIIIAYAAVTVGTNGVALTWKLRQTGTSGSTIKSSGALTAVATELVDETIVGFDTSPALTGQVYVLTLTVTSGSAPSTVSAAEIVVLGV